MPSVRQYFYRSLKNVLVIAVSMVVLILVCGIIDWFLPNDVHNGFVITALHFAKEIGIGFSLLVVLFIGCRAYLVCKTEQSFGRELIKMTPSILFWGIVVLYGANYFSGGGGYDCQKYNYSRQLNGGVKEFKGEKYVIKICGSGVNDSHFFGDSMDAVELTITNEQGELLAKRHYKIFWDGQPGHEPLTIGASSVIYQDDDKQVEHSITMPPTVIDWIRARVPILN